MTLPTHDTNHPEHWRERRRQILQAAMACFARRGFHQTTMQDISAEAQISVGLIYRYFDNKDAVISVMAREHLDDMREVLDRARSAPTLFDALETVFNCHCQDQPAHVQATFVVDLFAEAGRNPHVAALLREVMRFEVDGVSELIAGSDEARRAAPEFAPRQAAELIVDTAHGLMVRAVADGHDVPSAEIQERQRAVLRGLWSLLFPTTRPPAGSER